VLNAEFVSCAVTAEISIQRDYPLSDVLTACEARLRSFLHPVTGGAKGAGWEFGATLSRSSLRQAISAVTGVTSVPVVELEVREERPGLLSSGRFLISSGLHRLCVTPE
jgi:hypothetical protein